ncbi:6393_t:CDS:2, partial [Funneliformis geosporum]
PKRVEEAVKGFINRRGKRLWRLRVIGAGVRFKVEDPTLVTSYPLSVIINNVSGWNPPYPTKEWLQPRRYKDHLMCTTYAYDFPELFCQAIRILWNRASHHSSNLECPSDVLEAKELVLDENNNLQEWRELQERIHLVWLHGSLLFLPPPEYPKEDQFFYKPTELARSLGIPRVYLAANSGARIRLAEEVMNHFNTYKQLHQNGRKSVIAEEIVEEEETRHKITDIIGSKDGLGVECLKGSGLIAGITSRAYEDIFTITLVTCRSV